MNPHVPSVSFHRLFGVIVLILATGLLGGVTDQAKPKAQVSAMSSKFPNAARQPMFCTNCARLSVHICSIPGYGCLACGDELRDIFGITGFFDPDYWIKNHGTLPSNPGTLTVQWYDLATKSNRSQTVAIPSIPAGGEDFVTFAITGILVKAADGVTLTLDYSDANGSRHSARKVTKCPDN